MTLLSSKESFIEFKNGFKSYLGSFGSFCLTFVKQNVFVD